MAGLPDYEKIAWGVDPGAGVPTPPSSAIPLLPTANYGFDPVSKLWKPQEIGSGGAPIVEIEEENDYVMVPIDLSAAHADTSLGVAGRSVAIYLSAGVWSFKFDTAAHDVIPVTALTFPSMITFVREFTDILVTNNAQAPGTAALLYVGQRI